MDMTRSYVNATALSDWRRTLTAVARDIDDQTHEALQEIDSAMTANPAQIELREFVALLESVGKTSRPSAVAWHVGLSLEWPLGSELGRAVLGFRSLGSALHWMCQYFPLLQDSAYLRLDVDEDWTTLSYKILDPTIWPRHEDAMFTLGIYARLIQAAALEVWGQVQVTVEAEQNQVNADLESIVKTSVVYGGHANAIRFPSSIINSPMNLAPPCEPEVLKKLSADLSRKKRKAPITHRTRQMIFREMIEGCVSQQHIARELGISSRTLRRRLSEEGHSFQGLLDQCRMEFAALEFKIHRKLSLSDMALRLGYSEHSTFSRAFSRWAGMAPQDYRRNVSGTATMAGLS